MITRCVCYNRRFTELKRIADQSGARTVDALQRVVEFGRNCQLCLPYVRLMLETGRTSFDSPVKDE